MASIPPPPPPPLPPEKNRTKEQEMGSSSCYERIKIDEPTIREEIQKFFDTSMKEQDCQCSFAIYSHIQPILQNGPVCGIVALSMAAELLLNEDVDPEVILREAKKQGYTRKGEMFSATAMSQLAMQNFPNFETILFDTRESTKELNITQEIVNNLIEGNAIIMPYDAGPDHRPALNQNGHAAHWTILHGIAVATTDAEQQQKVSLVLPLIMNQVRQSTILKPKEISSQMKGTLKELLYSHMKTSQLFVICHQGKSKHAGIWKLDDLLKSNENLTEISPKLLETKQHKGEGEEDSLILCNMTEFLKCKLIILKKKK